MKKKKKFKSICMAWFLGSYAVGTLISLLVAFNHIHILGAFSLVAMYGIVAHAIVDKLEK